MIENKKKLKEERQIEELKKLQIDAGLIPASHMQRLDWLYQGPECNKDITTAEEFLIGKPLNDKPEEKKYFTPVFQESYSNPQNEIFTKIHEDPVFLMKKEELKQRKDLEDNPYKMKMLLKKIEQEVLDKINKKDKKSKKNKKEKKHKKDKKHKRESDRSTERDSSVKSHESRNKKDKKKSSRKRSRSSSRDKSSSSESYDKRHRIKKHRDYEDKMNLSLNESERSTSKVHKYKMDLNKNDAMNKNNFGLVDSKGDKVQTDRKKNLGPDENLYKNRMEMIEREAELRKKRSNFLIFIFSNVHKQHSFRSFNYYLGHTNVKILTDEEKDKLRLEMENRAKGFDSLKEEKYHERMNELKDKEEKIHKNQSDRGCRKYQDEKPKFLRNFEDQAYNKTNLNLEDIIRRSRYNKEK